ncbi:MAG: MBL fold metallo-hydrolase [Candidatus Thorarchaeota archaeon]
MKALDIKLPETKNKAIRDILQNASKIAVDKISGNQSKEEQGPFGESLEYLAFELARKEDLDISQFSDVKKVYDQLLEVFRDVVEEISVEDLTNCLTLGLYGYIVGNYIDEDFRYLYRYTFKDVKNHGEYQKWLIKGLSFIACFENVKPEDVLQGIREWIRFLGVPLVQPSEFLKDCALFDIELDSVLESDGLRLHSSIVAHPEYLEEAVLGRTFEEVYQGIKNWASDILLSRLFKSYSNKVYAAAGQSVDSEMDVAKAIDRVSKFFRESGFQVSKEETIPVKLQNLPSPPPPEAINPVVFEMIPQKLRVHLMTSVAYSTKTKKVEILFIGGPRIGRSGILIKTDTGGIVMDYGLSVANQTIPEWVPELETIDTILVSHSHLDHIGGLPILYENFTGKWCSTLMTGGITMALLEDALKVGTPLAPRKHDKWDRISLFNQNNIDKVAKNHVKLEVGKTNEVAPGILVTPIDACHIPGSVSYLVDVEGVKILYTGDFNLDQSILFPGANLPEDPKVVIFDGTYWGREDFDRARVTEQISNIVQKKGPVIIPSFAVGRSQEILKILDTIGITRSRNVIAAGMAERVTKLVGISGDWQGMKKNKTELDKDDILVAGGGMMGGGHAKYHFEQHKDNPDAAVILCGYLAPRTAGWNLLNGYEPHKCHVEYARLSAHSSSSKLHEYITSCKGKKVMVHTPAREIPKGVLIPKLNEKLTIST